jgi:hypothetical protein
MSSAPESLASERFRELRKIDEKVWRLSQDLAEAREVIGTMAAEKTASAYRDRQLYADALAEGKGRPAKREEEKVAAELADTEVRAEALKLAVESALDARAKLLKQNHPLWRQQAMRELTKAKKRYESAICELEAARDGLSDEATLVAWLDSGSQAAAANDLLGGRVGADPSGRQPVNFARTIEELCQDCEHLANHPATHTESAASPRLELAHGAGAQGPQWEGGE